MAKVNYQNIYDLLVFYIKSVHSAILGTLKLQLLKKQNMALYKNWTKLYAAARLPHSRI